MKIEENPTNSATWNYIFIIFVPILCGECKYKYFVFNLILFSLSYLSNISSLPKGLTNITKVGIIIQQHPIWVGTSVQAALPLSLSLSLLQHLSVVFFPHLFIYLFSKLMSQDFWRDEWCCVCWDGRGWLRMERTRGWRGHTLNPWVKMYLLKINNGAAISSCSRWFYNLVSEGGEGEERDQGQRQEGDAELLLIQEHRAGWWVLERSTN